MKRSLATIVGVLALGCSISACDLEPDVGPAVVARCDNGDTDPDRDVSFQTDIVPLIGRSTGGCLQCHHPTTGSRIGVTIGGLALDTYDNLIAGGARSANDIVIGGAPCDSTLFRKLGAGPPFGSRMPNDGPPFWADRELNLMHDWIAEGARNN